MEEEMTSFAQRQAVKRYKKTEKGKAAQQEAQERYARCLSEEVTSNHWLAGRKV